MGGCLKTSLQRLEESNIWKCSRYPNQIQERVPTYVKGMLKDGYIDKKTKQYLIQTNVKPGRFWKHFLSHSPILILIIAILTCN